ncbi:MAG: S41 family peptidase [Pseudomonadota bacterium]
MKVFLFFLLLISFGLSASERAQWKKINFHYDHLKKFYLNDQTCLKSSSDFLSCIFAANNMLFSLEQPHLLLPGRNFLNSPSLAKRLGRVVHSDGIDYKIWTINDIPTRRNEERLRDRFLLIREAQSTWLTFLEWQNNNVSKIFDNFNDHLQSLTANDYDLEVRLTLAGINSFLSFARQTGNHLTLSLNDDTQGESPEPLQGIGILRDIYPVGLLVVNTFPGAAAHRAGIRAHDWIIVVDGKSLVNLTMEEANQLILGKENSSAEFIIQRGQQTLKFIVVRNNELARNITSKVIKRKNKKLGSISIVTFDYRWSATELEKVLRDMEEEKVDGLVLDLRDNISTNLSETNAIASLFLEKDKTLVHAYPMIKEKDRDRDNEEFYLTTLDRWSTKLPLTVLINNYTANASEALAGALAENGRAYLVGNKSAGMGSYQGHYAYGRKDFHGKVNMSMSTHILTLPSGRSFNHVGLSPHWMIVDPVAAKKSLRSGDLMHYYLHLSENKPINFQLPEEVSSCVAREFQRIQDSTGDLELDSALLLAYCSIQ